MIPCTVLDPFGGAGTTGLVAERHGRDSIRWDSVFRGFVLDDSGQPRARFADAGDGDEWEAYLYNGHFCVGSSADPLVIDR